MADSVAMSLAAADVEAFLVDPDVADLVVNDLVAVGPAADSAAVAVVYRSVDVGGDLDSVAVVHLDVDPVADDVEVVHHSPAAHFCHGLYPTVAVRLEEIAADSGPVVGSAVGSVADLAVDRYVFDRLEHSCFCVHDDSDVACCLDRVERLHFDQIQGLLN